jgi:hypothetical protein
VVVPVEVSAGLVQHRDLKIQYSDVSKLSLENGNYQINEDLGAITLVVASEASAISFESTTQVMFNASQNLDGLVVNAPVSVKPGVHIVINTTSYKMSGDGSLDLAKGALQVHYAGGTSPFSAIRASVFAHAIMTSSADGRHTLGYMDTADGVNPTLPKQTVIVTYALKGDANLDRSVGFADLVLVAQHYGLASNANWDDGDFDLDGKVGFSDLVIVAQNYGQNEGPIVASAAAALVPVAAAPTRTVGGGDDSRLRRRR